MVPGSCAGRMMPIFDGGDMDGQLGTTSTELRRMTRSRSRHERRRAGDRRRSGRRAADHAPRSWIKTNWPDQRLQFLTRYLFGAIGVVYFNFVFEYVPTWMTLPQINAFLLGYFVWVTVVFAIARHRHYSPARFRVAMVVDVIGVSLCALNDPFVVPISTLVYIVIVLGNGMRYGMRCFSETLVVTFFAATVTLTARYSGSISGMTAPSIFLNVFAAIILIYAYVLMSRVDASRRDLEESSRTDPLTGLLNRSALRDVSERMLASVRAGMGNLVVLFADLDKFKAVNDTLGHAAGDRVLRQVAAILRDNVRSIDPVARYGGDEFVLLLRDTTLDQAAAVGQRIQRALGRWAGRNDVDISMTLGIGEAPVHGTDLDALLAGVDKALYQSKAEHGAGGLCYAAACAASVPTDVPLAGH